MVAGMAGAKRSATMGRHNLVAVCFDGPPALQTIPPAAAKQTFGPFAPVPLAGKRYLLIAQATAWMIAPTSTRQRTLHEQTDSVYRFGRQ